jgi:hypothetical protein
MMVPNAKSAQSAYNFHNFFETLQYSFYQHFLSDPLTANITSTMYQYPSDTSKSAAPAPVPSIPSQELTLLALMGSTSPRSRTFLLPGSRPPPGPETVIGIIESVLDLIEGNDEGSDEDKEEQGLKPTRPSSLRGARRQ